MNAAEKIELELLLEGIYRHYGYDFRDYARASLVRRLRHHLELERLESISALQHRVLHDEAAFWQLLRRLTINVTEMFRDPSFYLSLREQVVPALRGEGRFKVWVAGCSSGEEVYSLAIVLKEEGLYERTQIYATDICLDVLRKAREGRYALERMQAYTANYQKAGGRESFSDYYRADDCCALMDSGLKGNILFADHNLASDGVFGEMHLILCRNVLIYFNRDLQERALMLFRDSLVPGGFLGLGSKESLRFAACSADFADFERRQRLYRRRT